MVIETLADLHREFSLYMRENVVPATNDKRYIARTDWFNRGRDDIAKRAFFKTLLKQATLTLQAGVPTYDLAADLNRQNGLYVLTDSTGRTIFTNPMQPSPLFTLSRDFATGRYQMTFADTPTEAGTAPYWYFATPPPLVNPTDLVLVDGEAVLFFALKTYFFINGPEDKYGETRDEYENLIDELVRDNSILPPGQLLNMGNSARMRYGTTSEKQFYTGDARSRS